jgi:hypothetical protein
MDAGLGRGAHMRGKARVRQPFLLIGEFDPIDAATVTLIGRLAEKGPVHLFVLDAGSSVDGGALTSAQEREEILRYIRGVSAVTVVEDDARLDMLLAGSDAAIRWLVPRRTREAHGSSRPEEARVLSARP